MSRPGPSTLRLSVGMWLALRELFASGRIAYTAINTASLILVAFTITVFGYYAMSTYQYHERLLMDSQPTRILAICPLEALHDPDMRFNRHVRQKIRALPGVAKVFEHVTIGVRLSAPGAPAIDAYPQSTVPGDPRLAAARLVWGTGVCAEDANEIVLSEALLARICAGGAKGGRPHRVRVSLERSGDGSTFSTELEPVGVLKGGHDDEAYLPLRLIQGLDLWASSRLAEPPRPGQPIALPPLRFRSARVLVNTARPLEALEREAAKKHLNVRFRRVVGPFEQRRLVGEPVVEVRRLAANRGPVRPRDVRDALREANVDGEIARSIVSGAVRGGTSNPDARYVLIKVRRVEEYDQVRRALRGFALRPRFEVRARKLIWYEATDAASATGWMSPRLLAILKNERMSAYVFGNIELRAHVFGCRKTRDACVLLGSTPDDPTRWMHKVVAGGWLADAAAREVVLPRYVADALAADARMLVGTHVVLRFHKAPAGESVALGSTVVGITENDTGAIPLAVATRVQLWRQGVLHFDGEAGRFVDPTEVYASLGRPACNVCVKDIDCVRPIVARLRQMGYQTQDSLRAQESLFRLGKSLMSFVVLVASGALVLGTVNIGVTTWMHTRSKMFRMGILLSAGVSRPMVFLIFLVIAATMVLIACVTAAVLAVALEPSIRCMLYGTGITFATYVTDPIASRQFWWIFIVSLGACSLSAFVGVVFSAWKTCSMRICELFGGGDR